MPSSLPPAHVQRYLSLWLPLMATDRIMRHRYGPSWRSRRARTGHGAEPPLVISRLEKSAQRIAFLDERASGLGLKPGMGIADARAMHPLIEVVEEEVRADRRLLEGLADWCDRYTPLVALDGGDGLLLDITGCAHLFGGEQTLASDLASRLSGMGLSVRIGLASTPGAAWAAARFVRADAEGKAMPIRSLAAGEEADFIAPLPLASLRIGSEVVAGLESVGLRRVGAILDKPRAPLARRFGRELLLRLDQALGRIQEAISPRLPVPVVSAERRFPEPIGLVEDIERIVLLLARSLESDLERRQAGATQLELRLFRVDGAVSRLRIGASRPLRSPPAILRLFRERITGLGGDLDAGFGFELIRLAALELAPLRPAQTDLSAEPALDAAGDAATLADRLRARLGSDVLLHGIPVESHVPERAILHVPVGFPAGDRTVSCITRQERPIRLFARPQPVEIITPFNPLRPPHLVFRWRQIVYRGMKAEGPERVAREWWRLSVTGGLKPDDVRRDCGEAADLTVGATRTPSRVVLHDADRDYYRIEDESGRRYWLFREMVPLPESAEQETQPDAEAEPRHADPSVKLRIVAAEVPSQSPVREASPSPAAMPRWYMHGLFA